MDVLKEGKRKSVIFFPYIINLSQTYIILGQTYILALGYFSLVPYI